MRRLVSNSVVLVVGLVLGGLCHRLAGRVAQAGEDAPEVKDMAVCGDVNLDGALDLSDPVLLLNHLFLGEASPECRSSCVERGWPPVTGQATCYDMSGNVVDCDDMAYPGQDAAYRAGRSRDGRFVSTADGAVSDTWTGLVWAWQPAPSRMSWQEALRYCDRLILCQDGTWTTDALEAEDHGGVKYDDWRLPNIKELQTLTEYDRVVPPAIDAVFLHVGDPLVSGDWGCWSSSTRTSRRVDGGSASDRAWVQGFAWGIVENKPKTEKWRVRAVRGGL